MTPDVQLIALLAVVGPVTLGAVAAPLIALGVVLLALAVVVYRKDRRE